MDNTCCSAAQEEGGGGAAALVLVDTSGGGGGEPSQSYTLLCESVAQAAEVAAAIGAAQAALRTPMADSLRGEGAREGG